jgi:hypothetical protein
VTLEKEGMRRRLTGGGGVHKGFPRVPNRWMGGEGGGVGSFFGLKVQASVFLFFHFWRYRGVWRVFLFLMKDFVSEKLIIE